VDRIGLLEPVNFFDELMGLLICRNTHTKLAQQREPRVRQV
jgi:hypothetical protein